MTNALCWLLSGAMLILTIGFMNGEALGLTVSEQAAVAEYTALFDDTIIHTIDITADESAWANMLENAQTEEYIACNIAIDGETVQNAAVRPKGNTSLSQTTNGRYSLKIEFDHFENSNTYRGLDKLVLNNLIQDNTYLKDWLCYTLFRKMGVAAPLCSFAVVRVNGEYYGLCLALEAIEESFLQRNYGDTDGDLYKPDSSMGGGADLSYSGDSASSYEGILDSAVTTITSADRSALIAALEALSAGDAANSIDMDAVLRYFVVHNFVINGDSYTGSMLHNYYLYQDDGLLSMLPWDYNLAFGAFTMGGGTGGSSADSAVNWPLDDPLLSGSMSSRPMLAWIFDSAEYTAQYHELMDTFISKCFESGWFEQRTAQMISLLSPYVLNDTTSFTDHGTFVEASAALVQFCTLRSESLRGQLSGEIPATSEGQAADSSALIDASDLSIDIMGGMNNGGGMAAMGNMGAMQQDRTSQSSPPSDTGDVDDADTRQQGGMQPPDGTQFPDGFNSQSSGNMQFPDGLQMPEGMTFPNGFQNGDRGQFPQDAVDRGDMMNGSFGGTDLTDLLLTGISLIVLLAALLFARLYRRR